MEKQVIVIDVLSVNAGELGDKLFPALGMTYSHGRVATGKALVFASENAKDVFKETYKNVIEGWLVKEGTVQFTRGCVVGAVAVGCGVGGYIIYRHLRRQRQRTK